MLSNSVNPARLPGASHGPEYIWVVQLWRGASGPRLNWRQCSYNFLSMSSIARSRRENKMQIPESDRAALNAAEPRVFGERAQIAGFDMPVAVKAAENTSSLPRRSLEIDHKPSSTRPENPPNFAGALPP